MGRAFNTAASAKVFSTSAQIDTAGERCAGSGLKSTMFGGVVALIGLPKLVKARPKQLVLADLVRMREQGLTIIREDFRCVFLHENKHRDFAACSGCGAKTSEQHETSCSRTTALVQPD